MKKLALIALLFVSFRLFSQERILFISPNNDGKKDELRLPLRISDKRPIVEWRIEICDESGKIVKVIENKEFRPEVSNAKTLFKRAFSKKTGVKPPTQVRWNCILDNGETAPDGKYFFTVYSKDDNDNESRTEKFFFAIDTVSPQILVRQIQNPDELVFSPGGETEKSSFKIEQSGSEEDEWTGVFSDIEGKIVRTIKFSHEKPASFFWDGFDDNGNLVPDGVYAYSISATDKAGNKGEATLRNIIVDTVKPELNLTLGGASFSPNGDGKKDEMALFVSLGSSAGLQNWNVEIKDGKQKTVKSFSGTAAPPAKIDFDGRSDSGEPLADGNYSAQISANFRNGWSPTAKTSNFLLKTAFPTAKIAINSDIFSPDGDENLDSLKILQKGSADANWTGEILSEEGSLVRRFEFGAKLPESLEWTGISESGEIAPDGTYFYRLSAIDSAENSAAFESEKFVLDTRFTEVILTASRNAFNPKAQGEKSRLYFKPVIKSAADLDEYSLCVYDANDNAVRLFSGKGNLPAEFEWDGAADNGEVCGDGDYYAVLQTVASNGNHASSSVPQITIDSCPPQVSAKIKNHVFNPAGESKPALQIEAESSAETIWLCEIRSEKGEVAKSVSWEGNVENFAWDGRNDAGNLCADGRYLLHIWTEDAAGNFAESKIDGIVLDCRAPKGFLTLKNEQIAPASDDSRNTQTIFINVDSLSGIESWTVAIKNSKGASVKTWRSGEVGDLPKSLEWNGVSEKGTVEQGIFYATFDALYEKGDSFRTTSGQFLVWNMPPKISAKTEPKFFSPDNDDENDDLFVALDVSTPLELDSWSFCVKDPQNGSEFWKTAGASSVPESLVWNGISNRGELVQSATDYPWEFSVTDKFGQESVVSGEIAVDVLVLRFGDVLKIQIPSIVFADSRSDFEGLSKEVVEKNKFVLKRIAQCLNKFKDYQVTVEGHANKVVFTDEETAFNLRLSADRAAAVKKMLAKMGVSESRLSTAGKGDSEPVVPFDDIPNRWKNRRVEFILQK